MTPGPSPPIRRTVDNDADTGPGAPGLIDECVAWLQGFLKDDGPAPSADVFDAAEGEGFKEKMVYAAKKRANIKTRRSGFGGKGGWVWCL
jgi:hypothetical protein